VSGKGGLVAPESNGLSWFSRFREVVGRHPYVAAAIGSCLPLIEIVWGVATDRRWLPIGPDPEFLVVVFRYFWPDLIFFLVCLFFARRTTNVPMFWAVSVLLNYILRTLWLFNTPEPGDNLSPMLALFDLIHTIGVLLTAVIISLIALWAPKRLWARNGTASETADNRT